MTDNLSALRDLSAIQALRLPEGAYGVTHRQARRKHSSRVELDRQLEHAPSKHGLPSAPDLSGFLVGPAKVQVCIDCCLRLQARGCTIGADAQAVWDEPLSCDLDHHQEG